MKAVRALSAAVLAAVLLTGAATAGPETERSTGTATVVVGDNCCPRGDATSEAPRNGDAG